MYRITLNDEIFLQTDSPRWVKLNPSSGAWIQCDFADAQCIAIDCKRYSIEGRPPVDDAPDVVTVTYIDAAKNALDNETDINLAFYALQKMAQEIVTLINH